MRKLIFDQKVTCWDRATVHLEDDEADELLKRIENGEIQSFSDISSEYDLDYDEGQDLMIQTQTELTVEDNDWYSTFEIYVDDSETTPIYENGKSQPNSPPNNQLILMLL